jgi:hypothetical protein
MNRAEATEWAVVLTEFISIYHAIHALTMAEINAFGKRSKVLGDGHCYLPGSTLKRFLSIFSERIFDSSVDRGTPNLAAAPVGPKT